MRRPVRSEKKVTTRKLFNGGFPTVPNPLNINTGGTLPQVNNIAAPSGILASSAPLADQVAETALAQTFSPTVGMKSGGIASFDNGGFGSRLLSTFTQFLPAGIKEENLREKYDKALQEKTPDKKTQEFMQNYEASLPKVESTIDKTTFGGNIGILSSDLDSRMFNMDIQGITGPIQAGSWLDENSAMTSERIFPSRDRSFAAGSRSVNPEVWRHLDQLVDSNAPRSNIRAAFENTIGFLGSGLQSMSGGLDRISMQIYDMMIGDTKDRPFFNPNTWGQVLAVVDMVNQQPNYATDITNIAKDIRKNNPEIDSQDLIEQVAVALKTNVENTTDDPTVQRLYNFKAANLYDDVPPNYIDGQFQPADKTLSEIIDENKVSTEEIEDQISMKIDQSDPENQTKAMPPQSLIEEAYKRWEATGFSNEFITDVLQDENRPPEFINAVVNMRGEESTEGGDVIVESQSEQEDTSANMTNITNNKEAMDMLSIGMSLKPKEEVDETDGSREGINIPGSSEEDLKIINENLRKIDSEDKQGGQSQEEIENNLGEALADQVIKGDKAETEDATFKKYFEMFKNSMGKYEGKTEYEKGMDLVALGAAIAGGRSTNAISNIAEGVTKTIDRFTSDDQQRRAYNNQVRLSAGKFALTEMMTLAREERARDYEMLPYIKINKDGTITEKQFSLTDVINGKVPSDYKSSPSAIAELNYMTSINKAIQDGEDSFRYKPGDWKNVKEEAGEYNTAYDENHRGKFLAQEALKLVNDKDLRKEIFGIQGLGKEVKDRLVRFFGGKSTYTSRDQLVKELQQYFQALIPVKLRSTQSANSISNKDVQWLADAFMVKGAQEGALLTFAFAAPEAISAKLQSAYKDFADGEIKAINDMKTLYTENEGMLLPNKTAATDYIQRKYFVERKNEKTGEIELDFRGAADLTTAGQQSLADIWDMDYFKETGYYKLKE